MTLASGPATAELSDTPIWNLWNGQIGGNNTIQTGHGDFASLCGAASCAGQQSTGAQNAPNPNPTNAGVGLFRVDTTGPLRADGTPFFNSAGSGHINPFLRFQHNENQGKQPYGGQGSNPSGGVEAAYNTDDRSWPNNRQLQGDTDFVNQAKDHNAFNHSVRIGDLVQFDSTGKENATGGFFGFWLDVNEPGEDTKRTILLDELEFFVSDRADLNKYVPQAGQNGTANEGALSRVDFDANGNEVVVAGSAATKIWDMDFEKYGTDNNKDSICDKIQNQKGCGGLLVDSKQGSAGSGDFDMHVMLSVDLFKDGDGNLLENSYVYLYNFMGAVDPKGELEASAGFEEWITVSSVRPPPPPNEVSAPVTMTLMALGLVGAGWPRRRRRAAP